MTRSLPRTAGLLAALALLAAGTPLSAQKALVLCPPADASGCERVAGVLAGAEHAGGGPLFPGGVDRRFEELRTAAPAELQAYSLVFVPSLANAPYDLLREAPVRERLTLVLTGRVAVWSGTPDRGRLDGRSGGKLELIAKLARWAAAGHSRSGAGLVVLQDFSDAAADGASRRYDWIPDIAGVRVAAAPDERTYREVRKSASNPAGEQIVGPLAYDNMASFGLAAPVGPVRLGAVGAVGSGGNNKDGAPVLLTFDPLAAGRSGASVSVSSTTGFSAASTLVIDILPSTINYNTTNLVQVRVFSSTTFSAASIDPATVRFVIDGALPGAPVGTFSSGAFMTSVSDLNGDGMSDRVLQFRMTDLKAAGLSGPSHRFEVRGQAGTVAFQATDPTQPPVVSYPATTQVVIVPDSATIAVGGTVDMDVQLFSGTTPVSGRVVAWNSLDAAATVDANGLATGQSAGVARIVAASEGKADTAFVTVSATGTAPSAAADSYVTWDGVTLTVPDGATDLLSNDDLGSPAATLASFGGGSLGGSVTDRVAGDTVGFGSGGSLTVGADGGFTFTPAAGFTGSFTFQYRIANASGSSDAMVTINAAASGVAPSAVADAYNTTAGSTLTVPNDSTSLLANDNLGSPAATLTHFGGGSLGGSVTSHAAGSTVNFGSGGSLQVNANASFSFTPSAGFTGTFTFQYRITNASESSDAMVTITVADVPNAPTAVNDAYSTNEDVALNAAAPGVLGNDTDPESNPLTAVLVSGPAHGTLTLNANGSFTYTPAANYNGPDSFTYKANDGTSDSNVATVTLTINAVVDVPVATNDAYSTAEDTPLSVAAPGVLGNDSNPESGTLTSVLVSTTTNGVLSLAADGSFTYMPNANFSGTDQFTYKANNGGDSNVATVTITVNAVDDLPTAVADAYTTDEDVALNVAAPGVLGNDTDPESNALTAVLVTGPAHGTLTLNANGSFTYTPAADYFGADTFTYNANDGAGDSNTVTASITVNPVNDAPVAGADAYNALGNVQAGIPASGVLGNDTDVDNPGTDLSIVAATVSSNNGGTAVLSADGSFTYVSAAGFNGSDSFSYTVMDTEGATATGTVTMTVTGRYWFVDAAAPAGGDGRQSSRFQSLTPLNGAGGSGDPDQPGDLILVHAGTYSSAIALEANQQLIGQGIPTALTATVNGQTVTLLATGTAPTIGSASGNAITLASGNTLRGFVAGSAPGAAIAGSAVGTLTVADVSINNGSGRALDLTTSGTLSAAFGSISATGGTGNGINLVGQTGTLTSGSTSITNPSGTGIHVQGSGGFSFGSTTVAKGTTAGTGVHLQSNSGTTTFTSLGITTSGGTGLFA
ncbi:MAG TPA: Ig-like domain-containing protein, partial [Longimicrobiaceae bacterium]